MISIICQGDRRYNVYRSGQDIGCVTVSANPYHNRHLYLTLGLDQYDPAIANALFSLLREELGRPLQVMLYPTQEMNAFLIAGGFVRRRRCYEIEVSSSDLLAPLEPCVELQTLRKGSPMYAACCELLYVYYRAAHDAVSPLIVPPDAFCAGLPETVLCCIEDSKPIHCAFVEPDEVGYEIAYVCTAAPSAFHSFAQSFVWMLFRKCDFLTMECDDTDPAATVVKSLFRTDGSVSFDTYILK